jgi:hypothetical protein
LTRFLWALVIFLGLRRLLQLGAKRVLQNARVGERALSDPVFHVIARADLPPWVARKLGPLENQFTALGFRGLVIYRRESPRLNYSSILVSPDGHVVVHLWVARQVGISNWVLLFAAWRSFIRNILASARYGIVSNYRDGRRFQTSPVEILANGTVPGEREFLTVTPHTSPADACRLHAAAARAFATRGSLEPVFITTEHEFFEIERALCVKLGARLRARLAVHRPT